MQNQWGDRFRNKQCSEEKLDQNIKHYPYRCLAVHEAADSRYAPTLADDVVILETTLNYNAESQCYETFSNLTDEQVLAFMDRWHRNTLLFLSKNRGQNQTGMTQLHKSTTFRLSVWS